MTKDELQELYKRKILPESKDPYHFGFKGEYDAMIDAYNPMCGDKYVIGLKENNNVIDEAFFNGIGCSISKASISLMLRKVEGKTEEAILDMCKNFILLLEDSKPAEDLSDEALDVLVSLKDFDGRMDCVKLGWASLIEFLENRK